MVTDVKVTKSFLLKLHKMSTQERIDKAVNTGNFLYCLDEVKCLKELYGVVIK